MRVFGDVSVTYTPPSSVCVAPVRVRDEAWSPIVSVGCVRVVGTHAGARRGVVAYRQWELCVRVVGTHAGARRGVLAYRQCELCVRVVAARLDSVRRPRCCTLCACVWWLSSCASAPQERCYPDPHWAGSAVARGSVPCSITNQPSSTCMSGIGGHSV